MAEDAVVELAALSRAQLVERWTAIYRRPPPRGVKRGLLERAVSWHRQARRHGGLPSRARAQLDQTGAFDRNGANEAQPSAAPAPSGTRLVREWGGRTHSVEIRADGVWWNGHRYRSLSAVAKAITGARWSGPRFFGLDAERHPHR